MKKHRKYEKETVGSVIMGCFHYLWIRFLYWLRDFLDISYGFCLSFIWRKPVPIPPIYNPLLLVPAHELASKIRKKQIKSEELVQAYIARIKEVNPIVNAVVDERFEAAIEEAKAVDRLIASGKKTEEEMAQETPFLGVPFTSKENISAKGLHQTSGLVVRKDFIASYDAISIQLLKGAGAIHLGVTNVSELCSAWESYNNVYGKTKNPYNTTRIAGGSTGGEGAIIASAGSLFGIGTDIAGSIRKPALFNGIFGHKPTWEIVSNDGVHPAVYDDLLRYLVTGPLCRYASDLTPVLKVLAGPNVNKLKLDEPVDIKKLKIFYMEDDGGNYYVSKVVPELKEVQMSVIQYFEKVHGIPCQKLQLKEMRSSLRMILYMMLGKHPYMITEEIEDRKGEANLRKEVLKWFVGRSKHTLPVLLLATAEKIRRKKNNTERMKAMHELCDRLHAKFQEILGDDGIFLYPTHPTLAVYHWQTWLHHFNLAYGGIFNLLGFPATACTTGIGREGLPVGVQVIANRHNDHLCIAIANELEKGFGGWVPPCPVPKEC